MRMKVSNTAKYCKGSMTIEMAYIIPLIGMVFFFGVMGIFYYHDKNIIAACVYETTAVGSVKAREKDGINSETLGALFRGRIEGKCILLTEVECRVSVGDKEIHVAASAFKGRMKILIEQSGSITSPERFIRNIKRIK